MADEKKCIVKLKEYENMYWQGVASYTSDMKIFNYNDLENWVKNDSDMEVIFLDSKKGLEILIDKIHKLQTYVDNEEPILNKRKKELENLYSMPLIQEYVKKYNQIPAMIREPSTKNNKRIIEKILG